MNDLLKFLADAWQYLIGGGLTVVAGLYFRIKGQQLEKERLFQESQRIENENRQSQLSSISDYYADLSENARDIPAWIERATAAEARCEYLTKEVERLENEVRLVEERVESKATKYRRQRDELWEIVRALRERDTDLGLNLFSEPITEEVEAADDAVSLKQLIQGTADVDGDDS